MQTPKRKLRSTTIALTGPALNLVCSVNFGVPIIKKDYCTRGGRGTDFIDKLKSLLSHCLIKPSQETFAFYSN